MHFLCVCFIKDRFLFNTPSPTQSSCKRPHRCRTLDRKHRARWRIITTKTIRTRTAIRIRRMRPAVDSERMPTTMRTTSRQNDEQTQIHYWAWWRSCILFRCLIHKKHNCNTHQEENTVCPIITHILLYHACNLEIRWLCVTGILYEKDEVECSFASFLFRRICFSL